MAEHSWIGGNEITSNINKPAPVFEKARRLKASVLHVVASGNDRAFGNIHYPKMKMELVFRSPLVHLIAGRLPGALKLPKLTLTFKNFRGLRPLAVRS